MNKTIIIAEAGVNHNGSLELAKQLIDVAAEAGVDYVKFQTFKAEKNISIQAPKAKYQKETTKSNESQLEMVKKLELDTEAHRILVDYCNNKGIKFLSTAFDLDSIDLLTSFDLDYFKIPSGEITNRPLIEKIAQQQKPIILSTGMANLSEIEEALNLLVSFRVKRKDIIVLHCNTEYPTPMKDVNLSAMNTIAASFGVAVGYSDHTLGIEIPTAAVARGAVCIEKHFTLDKTMEGPDHRASLDAGELKAMVKAIRNIEIALGNGIKQPSPSEAKNKTIARKSLHLVSNLPQGHILKADDLIALRPGDGISPMQIDFVIGKMLKKDLTYQHKLSFEDFETA
jgi:N-acetylneuraminate synthase